MKTESELNAMNVTQLRDYAAAEEIDLAGATYKADIIAAIMLAEEEDGDEPGPGPDPSPGPEGGSIVTQEEAPTGREMPEDAPLVSTEAGTTVQLLANQREDLQEETGASHAQALSEIARKQEARKAPAPMPRPEGREDEEPESEAR